MYNSGKPLEPSRLLGLNSLHISVGFFNIGTGVPLFKGYIYECCRWFNLQSLSLNRKQPPTQAPCRLISEATLMSSIISMREENIVPRFHIHNANGWSSSRAANTHFANRVFLNCGCHRFYHAIVGTHSP